MIGEQPTYSPPGDWSETAALVTGIVINLFGVLPLSLCASFFVVVLGGQSTAMLIPMQLFFTGFVTFSILCLTYRTTAAQVLRWSAMVLNSSLFVTAGYFFIEAQSLELGCVVAVVGAMNLLCIAWTPQRHLGRRCPACGYDLQHLRTPGCPECGWRREPITP